MPQIWTDITNHAIPWKAVDKFCRRWVIVNAACLLLISFLGIVIPFLGILAGLIFSYFLIEKTVDKRISIGFGILAYILGAVITVFIIDIIYRGDAGDEFQRIITSGISGASIAVLLIFFQDSNIRQDFGRTILLIVSYIIAFSTERCLKNSLLLMRIENFSMNAAINILAFIWFNMVIGFSIALIQKEIPNHPLFSFKFPDNIWGKILRYWKPIIFYPLLLIAVYHLRFPMINFTRDLLDPPYQPPLTKVEQPIPIPDEPITDKNAREVVPIARWTNYDNNSISLIRSVKFSADSRFLWTCSISDRQIRIWSLSTSTFITAPMSCDYIDLNSTHQLLAVQYNGSIHLYNTTTWKELFSTPGAPHDTRLNPNGTQLATLEFQKKPQLRQTTNGIQLAEFPEAYLIDFNTNGTLLASGDGEGTVRIWRTADQQLIYTFYVDPDNTSKQKAISSVAFNPQGNLIAVASENGKTYLWSLESKQLIRTFPGSMDLLSHMEFNPDGTVLAIHSEALGLQLCQVSTGRPLMEYNNDEIDFHTFDFSPDGTMITLVGQNSDDILILGIPKRN